MVQASPLGLMIDRSAKQPVFEQICAEIRARVIAGSLAEGARLPPTRVLAVELGVSRSTVVTAYEQLVAEGYLTSRQGSGYMVCALGEVELPRSPDPVPSIMPQTANPDPIRHSFQGGRPDMRLFPHRQWAKAVARVCRTAPEAMLVGKTPFGHLGLRRAIAAHVAEWRGIVARPEQIIITAGASDALELSLRSLTEAGQSVGVEDPGYPPLRHLIRAQGLKCDWLKLDAAGACPPQGGDLPRLVALTPSHQYPLGGAMSPTRRQEFLNWARDHDAWVLEDDYDSEFRYAGRPIPAMAGFDRLDRTLYVGSFSKIFSGALRLGYVIVPEPLLPCFGETLDRFGVKASFMPQQALADFIDSGEFYRHLRRVRRIYDDRRRFLLDRLAQDFADLGRVEDHQAGMQLVLHLPDGVSDLEVARRARLAGVEIQPLSDFAAARNDGPRLNGLVLGFCASTEAELGQGLTLLRGCFHE